MPTLVAEGEGAGAIPLPQRTAAALVKALGAADTVFLHFSGYGYARWGLCRWLVEGLQAWKRRTPGRRLVTVFHEIYATGPIWRISFWTAPQQRRIARDLARLSDAAFVTSQGGHTQLRALAPDLSVEVLPVFSNVGEPADVMPLSARPSLAVVFGGSDPRARAYAAAAPAIAAGFDRMGITEVIDIGPGQVAPQALADRPVRALGALSAEEVSTWLSSVRIGLLDYPGHVLTKSSIAAAYFAHGVLAVNTSNAGRLPHDLADGREFVAPDWFSHADTAPQTIADAGLAWYRPHGLEATVRKITSLFV